MIYVWWDLVHKLICRQFGESHELSNRLRKMTEHEHLHFFASEQKHEKAHMVPSLVNGTLCSKKGESCDLVGDTQVRWPYIVSLL